MRTIDEEAALILSDPASSEQLRRLATAVVDRTDTATIEDMDYQVRQAEEAMSEAEDERDAAVTRAEGLQRDLEADKRQSAAMRQMLEGASDLLSKSHHTGAIEWRGRYLAWQAPQRG